MICSEKNTYWFYSIKYGQPDPSAPWPGELKTLSVLNGINGIFFIFFGIIFASFPGSFPVIAVLSYGLAISFFAMDAALLGTKRWSLKIISMLSLVAIATSIIELVETVLIFPAINLVLSLLVLRFVLKSQVRTYFGFGTKLSYPVIEPHRKRIRSGLLYMIAGSVLVILGEIVKQNTVGYAAARGNAALMVLAGITVLIVGGIMEFRSWKRRSKYYSSSAPKTKMPRGLSYISAYHLVSGIILGFFVLLVGLLSGARSPLAEKLLRGLDDASPFHGFVNLGDYSAIWFGLWAVTCLVIFWSVFARKRWGWRLVIISTAIDVVVSGLRLPYRNLSVWNIEICIELLILYYFYRPHVKAYFGISTPLQLYPAVGCKHARCNHRCIKFYNGTIACNRDLQVDCI